MHDLRSSLIRGETPTALVPKQPRPRPAPVEGEEASLTGIRIRRQETRRCDQRREPRRIGVVDRALIRHEGQIREVAVLNLSSRGVMIADDAVPAIGDRIEISFAGCNGTPCAVRWVRDGRIGMEFERGTLVLSEMGEVSGRREGERPSVALKSGRAPRHGLLLRGELHWRLGSMAVKLRNISENGAMLEGLGNLDPDTEVVLEVSGGHAFPGKVRWCRSRQLGVMFDEKIDPEILARPEAEREGADYVRPDYLKSETDPNSPWAARWDRLSADDL